MKNWPTKPTLIQGNRATDDRGSLAFINGFDISSFKRFYLIENHSSNFIRAWHGHLKEAKAILVIKGSAIVCAVELDDPISPNKSNHVERIVMSSTSPTAFYIPAGYANGFMTLSNDAQILVFSSTTLEESQGDDYRFEYNYWNPWEVVPR
jgi:dTDP-4-dehydrorhamnose 3,5-epimerase-like enzyme